MALGTTEKVAIGGVVTFGVAALLWWALKAHAAPPPTEAKAKVLDFSIAPVSGSPGEKVTATIKWQNTGTKDYLFDVVCLFDEKTNGLSGWGSLLLDVSAKAGEEKTSTIEITIPTVAARKYDGYAIIGDAREVEPGRYSIDKIYDIMLKEGMLEVLPLPTEIMAFAIERG
jgi:hypothetical protein